MGGRGGLLEAQFRRYISQKDRITCNGLFADHRWLPTAIWARAGIFILHLEHSLWIMKIR